MPYSKQSFILTIIPICLLFAGIFGTISSAQAKDSYRLDSGDPMQVIDEHEVCREVTNNCSYNITVPTKFSEEWDESPHGFLPNAPSCIDITYCDCETPWGTSVDYGDSVTAYKSSTVACGATCNSETRTCQSGDTLHRSLSGSYQHASCSPVTCPAGQTCSGGSCVSTGP